MPKSSMNQRELKRQRAHQEHKAKRNYLLQARRKVTNYSQQIEILTSLENLPRNSSVARQSNRCKVAQTSRAYNRLTGLSRYQLRNLGHQSMIPGLFKASW